MSWQGLKLKNISVSPWPTSWGVGIMDLDYKSTRTTSGLMFRDRIAVKRKLTLKWDEITASQAAAICQAVKGVFVEAEYDDLETGTRQTRTFYAGDRNAEGLEFRNGEVVWKNFTFILTER